ncbi:MAG: HAD-IIB family hydrolase [Verrucomicrobia bacterium]|nr:MAG: HAD-IIB family hydrolase [Verrucomicrobiota bacterium]
MAQIPKIASVLAFDFDGTLHDPSAQPTVPPEFSDLLLRLRRDHAIGWGINTGRSLPHLLEGLLESGLALQPDWVVAREREIYFCGSGGRWQPLDAWNRTCEQQMRRLFKHAGKLLAAIRHLVEHSTGAQWIAIDGDPAGFIARTDEEMVWIVSQLEVLTRAEPLLSWQRNSIYLRFGHRDFQKGSSLSEVARHYALDASTCFAIGDSYNDLAMLDARHARMIACPGNALADVKHHVAVSGGYLAHASHGAGAIEAVQHFFPQSKR